MKTLVIDNYDSFTYNLVAQLKSLGSEVRVVRNDEITPFEAMEYNQILLSPGPGIPDEAGNLKEIIRTCAPSSKILGICLGHQAIAEVFGGTICQLPNVYHGVDKPVHITVKHPIFEGFAQSFSAGRYHSWHVNQLPKNLELIASDEEGIIMAIQHKEYSVMGLQFHPESILSPQGTHLMHNWLKIPAPLEDQHIKNIFSPKS
jgi:anthranilate synthase component 2